MKIVLSPRLSCVVWSILESVMWSERVGSSVSVYSHYVIMFTNVHTHSHIMHAYNVVNVHNV